MIALEPLPEIYVPIDSAECALSTISMALRAGCSPVLLSGPAGIGKTLLLRVMAERERKAFPRVRYLAGLPPASGDLPGLLLQVLYAVPPPPRSHAAEIELVHRLHAEPDGRSLLLVDDLDRADESCVRKLAALARAAKPALAIVAAGATLEDHHALTDALAAGFSVLLPESLPAGEMQAIYDAICVHADDEPAEILELAGGRPKQLVHELSRRDFDREHEAAVPAAKPPARTVRSPRKAVASACLTAALFAFRAVERPLGEFAAAVLRALVALADFVGQSGHAISEWARRSLESRPAELAQLSLARIGRLTALPAVLLIAAGVFALRSPPPARIPAAPPAPPIAKSVPATPKPAPALPAPASVDVHVNARPWARIWINGVDLGPTPLKRMLPPGTHRLEAEFPNGVRIRRKIEVAPDRRFVSLP